MYTVKQIPFSRGLSEEEVQKLPKAELEMFITAAIGDTAEICLEYLVSALNQDEIDTFNNNLVLIIEEDAIQTEEESI